MENWPETSESLILKVKDPQDVEAWGSFLQIYRPVIYRMARSRGLQPADAEDLAQQVFLSVAQAIEGWEPDDSRPPFRVWLARICRNAIINAVTRCRPDRGAGSTSVQQALHDLPARDEATRELMQSARCEAIRWAADQIRPEFSAGVWTMFEQSFLHEVPVAAVAKSLGKTAGAVYMARFRVMQRLREKVQLVSDVWSEGP